MKKTTSCRLALAALIGASLSLAGCSDSGPSSKVFVRGANGHRLRVAVIPFDNVSRDPDAGRVITNTVITYLLSTGTYDVVEPGVVNAALTTEGARITDGITADLAAKLQPRLNADAYIMGMVEEYGEVRIGPDSYPAVSFSARLLNAHTAEILWAGTISKTGADSVKVFDIGRVSSLGKLSKKAVAAMSSSLAKAQSFIVTETAATAPGSSNGTAPGPTTPDTTEPGPTTPVTTPITTPVGPSPTGAPRYLDETATYAQAELTALLKDVATYKLGEVTYKKHFHDTIETKYTVGDTGKELEVRLVDYLKADTAVKFIQTENAGAGQTLFDGLPAFTSESDFGYYHLDVAPGRFGVYVRGPKENKADVDALVRGLIALLR